MSAPTYPDGQSIAIGDRVWWDEGVAIGYVREILATAETIAAWGLTDPSILIEGTADASVRSSAVCYPLTALADEGIGLLSQDESDLVDRVLQVVAARLGQGDTSNLGVSTAYEDGKLVRWVVIRYGGPGLEAYHVSPSLESIESVSPDGIGFLLKPTGGGPAP